MKTAIVAIIGLVVIVVVGVGAFFAGNSYGQSQAQNARADFFRQRQGAGGAANVGGQGGQNGQAQFGRAAATGTVSSVSGNTIMLTQQDGSTVTVTVDPQTIIQKSASGTIADIQPGERITVASDQTGSTIVARGIQIRPAAQAGTP